MVKEDFVRWKVRKRCKGMDSDTKVAGRDHGGGRKRYKSSRDSRVGMKETSKKRRRHAHEDDDFDSVMDGVPSEEAPSRSRRRRSRSPRVHTYSRRRSRSPSFQDDLSDTASSGESEHSSYYEKKVLRLDRYGIPTGPNSSMFIRDLHAFSKELDPTATPGWLGQSHAAKKRLLRRMHGSWEFVGGPKELDETYFRKKMSVAVSRRKFELNERIRRGEDKPAEVSDEVWEKMLALQSNPDFLQKSGIMSRITQGRRSKDGLPSKKQKLAMFNLVRFS